MDEQNVNAVSADDTQAVGQVSDATVEPTTDTPSASVEQTTSNEAVASEKTETTQGQEDGGNTVPYERFSEVNAKYRELEQANAELSQKAALLDRLQQDPTIAQEFLKRMPRAESDPVRERADKQLKEMGYLTKEEAAQMVQEELSRNELRSKVVNRFDELEGKYDGSDGLPAFKREEIIDYMDKHGYINDENGVPDVERTFKVMHMEAFIDNSAKGKKATFSEKPGQPQQTSTANAEEESELKEARETGDFMKVMMRRSSKFK